MPMGDGQIRCMVCGICWENDAIVDCPLCKAERQLAEAREALLRLTKRHDGMLIEYAFLEAAVLEGQLEAAQYTARKIAMARTERIINGLNPPATLGEGEGKGG